MGAEPVYSWELWQQVLPFPLQRILQRDQPLTETQEELLADIANELGMDLNSMLQSIDNALLQTVQ